MNAVRGGKGIPFIFRMYKHFSQGGMRSNGSGDSMLAEDSGGFISETFYIWNSNKSFCLFLANITCRLLLTCLFSILLLTCLKDHSGYPQRLSATLIFSSSSTLFFCSVTTWLFLSNNGRITL